MGREIRQVPPNWQHPKDKRGHFKPLHNETFETAVTRWKSGYAKWESGEDPDREKYGPMEYWEWNGSPPIREYYREYVDLEATWYQVYETVSEGTPITPPFSTLQELAEHLAMYGDSLVDSKHRDGPWGWDNAKAFVKAGWVPSGISVGGKFFDNSAWREVYDTLKRLEI